MGGNFETLTQENEFALLRGCVVQGHQEEPSDKGVKEEGKDQGRDKADVGSPNVVDASKD